MGQDSKIQWTDSTWNPLVGCTRVSQGCLHCYAETMAARIANSAQAALRRGRELTDVELAYREVVRWERGGMFAMDEFDKALPKWNNEIRLLPSVLTDPLRWRTPRRVFVNSMTDLFHEKVPFDYVDKVFAVMALTPQHVFQILTKRPERMAEYLAYQFEERTYPKWSAEAYDFLIKRYGGSDIDGWSELLGNRGWGRTPLANVWLGTSVEDQEAADARIPHLLKIPASVRFLSCEPLIGAVDLRRYLKCTACGMGWRGWDRPWEGASVARNMCPVCQGYPEESVDWVIAGGESGPGARPMVIGWAKDLRRQCEAAGVPFFMKQLGKCPTNREGERHPVSDSHGSNIDDFPEILRVREFPE